MTLEVKMPISNRNADAHVALRAQKEYNNIALKIKYLYVHA
jgi:hypothetical protein